MDNSFIGYYNGFLYSAKSKSKNLKIEIIDTNNEQNYRKFLNIQKGTKFKIFSNILILEEES